MVLIIAEHGSLGVQEVSRLGESGLTQIGDDLTGSIGAQLVDQVLICLSAVQHSSKDLCGGNIGKAKAVFRTRDVNGAEIIILLLGE